MEYELRTSHRAKSIRVKVTSKGTVVVSAPKLMPRFLIDRFVNSQQEWITRTQHTMAQRLSPVEPDRVLLFGQWYPLHINRSLTEPTGIVLKNQVLWQTPSDPQATSAQLHAQLERYFKNTAEKYIVPRTHQWATKMDITFRAISLRQQKTRWGSCSSQGNLQFNWRLVHYAPAIIDYVIIHELAHRQQMNHSAAFWAIVRRFDPAFTEHRGWLKRHGGTIG